MAAPKHNSYPPWSPRFWNGMRLGPYFRLVAQGGFRIHPLRVPMFVLGTGVSTLNSLLGCVQDLCLSRKISATELVAPPIFIIGHWRSGTTLLHELMTLDKQFAFPNNFDAFCPNHLLLTRSFLEPLVQTLLPGKRPMDAMAMDARSPQEDDFGLISLGAATMYREIAFPNRRFDKSSHVPISGADHGASVLQALTRFLQVLTRRYSKPLVLKSPPHTARLALLAKGFPDAKFVHISRHPDQIAVSTVKLWSALDWTQGFQIPRYSPDQLLDYVNQRQLEMYREYGTQRIEVPDGNLLEIKFDDLIRDPQGLIQSIYEKWNIPGVEGVLPKIAEYFSERQGVRPSVVTLDPNQRAKIRSTWGEYAEKFGYDWPNEVQPQLLK